MRPLPPTDPNLVMREFHNTGTEDAIFSSVLELQTAYTERPEWRRIVCPAGHAVEVPHAYYLVSSRSGRPISGRWAFGPQMSRHQKRH